MLGKRYLRGMGKALVTARGRERTSEERRALKAIGKAVSELAAKRKIGLKQLAYEADVSKGFIYDLVNGVGNPSVLLLHRLAQACDTSVKELVKYL